MYAASIGSIYLYLVHYMRMNMLYKFYKVRAAWNAHIRGVFYGDMDICVVLLWWNV